MKRITPLKRVGESASFKGVRGPFLINFIFTVLGCFLGILILLTLPILSLFRYAITGLLIVFMIIKYKKAKEKSKGDIHKGIKSNCRKIIQIKGSKFNVKEKIK